MRNTNPSPPLVSAGLALLLAVPLGCREVPTPDDAGAPHAARPLPEAEAESKGVRVIYPAAPGSFVDLAADLRPSIVHIASSVRVTSGPASVFPGDEASYALGSGFIVDNDGYIVTADHVVKNAPDPVRVILHDGIELSANVVGRDSTLDLALLKISASPRLKPAMLGDSDTLQPGEWVVALGNAFGDELNVSAGVVSALGRNSAEGIVGPSPFSHRSFLQTDARITAANSGGPLVNISGQVVAMNSAVRGRDAGIGFALPINRIKPLLPQLRDKGMVTRAYLGIFIHPVTAERARELSMEKRAGVLVSEVIPGGPGEKNGLRAGDVILSYDGKLVTPDNFPWISATSAIGKPIPVVVWRGGKGGAGERTLTIVPEELPR